MMVGLRYGEEGGKDKVQIAFQKTQKQGRECLCLGSHCDRFKVTFKFILEALLMHRSSWMRSSMTKSFQYFKQDPISPSYMTTPGFMLQKSPQIN